MIKYINTIIILSLLFSGCSLFKEDERITNPNKITVNQNLLSSGQAKKTYLLLTNPSNKNLPIPKVTVNGNLRNLSNVSTKYSSNTKTSRLTKRIYKHFNRPIFNNSSSSRVITEVINYKSFNVGSTTTFNLNPEDIYSKDFVLKSREALDISEDIELFIWSDSPPEDIPDGSIKHLNDNFLDIYIVMTTLFGKHWGKTPYIDLLEQKNKDIHIILTDIDSDKNMNEDGVVYGYFYGGDTFIDESSISNGSNQNLNMVIDSYNYFGGPPGSSINQPLSLNFLWSSDNFEVALVISTLIHEFQHMIHFYNKNVTQNLYNTFVNEMFSMISEEILAGEFLKFTQNGTKYVLTPAFDRVPTFNLFWDKNSSFYWDVEGYGALNNYSMSYIMGTYLIRNYGFELFNEYMINSETGKTGIINALNIVDNDNVHTTTTLLKNFGEAVLRSSSDLNSIKKPFMMNINKTLNIDNKDFVIFPIQLFDGNLYNYYALTTDSNRLRNFEYNKGNSNAPFTALTLEELNDNSNIFSFNFLKESNIYIDLGELSSSDIIEIDFYNSDRDIEYNFVY